MTNANYKITKSPLIDTIFENRIGGKNANPNKLESTLENVEVSDEGIHIKLRLGGIKDSPWSLEVNVDMDDEEYQTIPKVIKGRIPKRGFSETDKVYKLKRMSAATDQD